ncbi:MAG: hypothetical protein ACRYFR_05000 [Janthinobacterium lividum]
MEVTKLDDGSGDVFVRMPHAPTLEPVRFDAKKWAEWWNKKQ